MRLSFTRAVAATMLASLAVATLPAGAAAADTPNSIRIGVTPGPHAIIMDEVAKLAQKRGLAIKIVEISDYAVPNAALNDGDLEANSFQNPPFLQNQIAARKYALVEVGKTILLPMGIYSKKLKRLADLPDGAQVAIPNDPTNGARGLKLLQNAGLLKLKDGGRSFTVSVADITENPKHLQIRELNAAQTPRSLDDLDAACINGNYAATAGLSPNRDALRSEGGNVGEALHSPYSNIIAVRAADRDKPWVKQLVSLYHSSDVRGFILRHFNGSIYPAF